MAAGKFTWYTSALKYALMGRYDLQSQTVKAIPLRDTYTPSTASHSALHQLVSHQVTASSTVINALTLASVAVTQSGVETVKFDANDLAGFSADGATIASFKYVGVYVQSASNGAGVDNLTIGFINLDTATSSASAGNSTQVNVAWSASGLGKLRGNP